VKFVFIADFFIEHVLGGGELNNEELVRTLKSNDFDIIKIQSHLVNEKFIEDNKERNFIVANFVNLSESCKNLLQDKNYVIYEHDHKYLKTRNPADYNNFIAPKEEIINYEFYKEAKAVLCQSKFHKSIVQKNLSLDNIVNLAGNLWAQDTLEFIREISKTEKTNKISIMSSPILHKNTSTAIEYCNVKNKEYELIPQLPYKQFLQRLGANHKLAFFPGTPETLARIVVEARMMNMGTITNNIVGAIHEDWFKLKGEPLIDLMESKREEISKKIIGVFNENTTNS
tara:strand:+ start:944 stop:1798 length:855 start_codon:yes stop_codon:yes gene_type:complete